MSDHHTDLPHEPDWKRVFDEAAESPPTRVWANIEARLDTDRRAGGVVMPLWAGARANAGRFGDWAVGLAATWLLIAGAGWFGASSTEAVTSAKNQSMGLSKIGPISENPMLVIPKIIDLSTIGVDKSLKNIAFVGKLLKKKINSPFTARIADVTKSLYFSNLTVKLSSLDHAPRPTNVVASVTTTLETDNNMLDAVSRLTTRPARFDPLVNNRDIESAPAVISTGSGSRLRSRADRWLSGHVLTGGFSANVNLASARQPFTNQMQTATGVQVGVGVQINKHWLAEVGVGYVRGRSAVQSPTRITGPSADALNAVGLPNESTQYADLVQGRLSANQPASVQSFASSPAAFYDTNQAHAVANDYVFVQVPAQVGYELRPRRKLGVAVLGGMIANIFVRNKVDNRLEIKPSDGMYEKVALSGSASVRLRYRSNKRWSATLAGVYQHALQPNTRPGSDLTSRPDMAGVTMGLNCHF